MSKRRLFIKHAVDEYENTLKEEKQDVSSDK